MTHGTRDDAPLIPPGQRPLGLTSDLLVENHRNHHGGDLRRKAAIDNTLEMRRSGTHWPPDLENEPAWLADIC